MTSFASLINFEKYPLAWKGYAMPDIVQTIDEMNIKNPQAMEFFQKNKDNCVMQTSIEVLQDDLNNAAMENSNFKNMVQLSPISTLKLFALAVKYVKEDAYKPLKCENDLEMYFSNYFDPLSMTVYIEKDAIDSSILKLPVFDMIANSESFKIIIENVEYIL